MYFTLFYTFQNDSNESFVLYKTTAQPVPNKRYGIPNRKGFMKYFSEKGLVEKPNAIVRAPLRTFGSANIFTTSYLVSQQLSVAHTNSSWMTTQNLVTSWCHRSTVQFRRFRFSNRNENRSLWHYRSSRSVDCVEGALLTIATTRFDCFGRV